MPLHAPLCREHCDCRPPEAGDACEMLNDSDGPFGDLPPRGHYEG